MRPAPNFISAVSSRSSNSYPTFENLHRVGFVAAAHGLRGEVFIRLFAETADWLDDVDQLNVLVPGEPAPRALDLTDRRVHKDGLIVTFAELGDRTAAERLKGAQVYIPEHLLVGAPGEAMYLKEVLNFAVHDPSGEVLGTVVEFAHNGAQDLIVLALPAGGRALVPFVTAFIVEIDFDKRVVRMDLPPGLLSL